MVLGYHVILGFYGFWLPNDPRGSWSDFVGAWELARSGRATKVETRQSVAHCPHDQNARLEAKRSLKYAPVHLTGLQARAVGRGFAARVHHSGLTVWACSIMPEHVHLIAARHRYVIERAVNLLKGQATRQLVQEGLHPFGDLALPGERPPAVFAEHEWKVYLDSDEDVRRAVRYVEENPEREGLQRQTWSFVTPYLGSEDARA